MALTTAPVELITLDDGVTITVDDNSNALTIISTDADASVGPGLDLYRNSASPADNDVLGTIFFHGEDGAGNKTEYARIETTTKDVSNGAEVGTLTIFTNNADTLTNNRFESNGSEIVINQTSGNFDFRVESDSSAYLILADAGDNAVYIGKSDSTQNTAGTAISPTLGVRATVDQNAVGIFNRTTDDGNVLLLRKDGVTVGQMAAKDGDVTVGTGDTGFRFIDGSDAITPHDISNNTGRDNAISLGTSGARYLNLFMNGGIQFGSRNNKLDDYEEGTWTPTIQSTGTASFSGATYTKVGRLVTCNFYVNTISNTTASTAFSVSLPFTAATNDKAAPVSFMGVDIDIGQITAAYIGGTTTAQFYQVSSSTAYQILRHSNFGANTAFYAAFTYMAV